jgi:hypothetical protein
MNTAALTTPLEHRIERLICGLAGVVSARAVAEPGGRIEEIHVLATERLHPKQVVRNVESALSAGLGLDIDRRVISVAQIRGDKSEGGAGGRPGALSTTGGSTDVQTGGTGTEIPSADRVVFLRFDARTDAVGQTLCSVVLARGTDEYSGSGTGPNTTQGRAGAAARALFKALESARDNDDVALEGAAIVEANGRSYVMVGARGLVGRTTVPLTGVAPVTRSPEEASILACLQATNRWAELPA